MIAPESLLRMYPLDALRAQIGEVLSPPLKPIHLRISEPISLGGLRTVVTFSVDKAIAPVDFWGVSGECEFEYDRLHLSSFTQGLDMDLSTALPAAAYQVLGSLLDKFRIPVVQEDIEEADFTSLGNVTLLASPKSYRWVGEVQARLVQRLYDITKLISVNKFTPPFTADFKTIDFKRIITQYLNIANASSLPVQLHGGMYEMGVPVEVGPHDKGDNTKVTLTFLDDPYVGEVDVIYGRRSFTKTYRFPEKVEGGPISTTRELASVLSARMGCSIASVDLLATPVDPMQIGETRRLIVGFAPTSPVYVGEIWIDYTRTL